MATKTNVAQDSVVVYIHGIGDQPPATKLKQKWDLALFGRELGDRSRMAYWADLLHPPAADAPHTAAARRTRTATARAPQALDLLAGQAGPQQQAFAAQLLERLGAPAAGLAAARQGPGKKVLPLPAWARRPISKAFLEAFVADTAAYFFKADKRRAIRQRLAGELAALSGQSVTLVAHSQGSIIAYEVLSALAGTLALDAFITIGSPLGLQEVQDFLDPSGNRIPKVVRRWHNFADPLDPVALDKGLASDFRSTDPDVGIRDETILNDRTRQLWGFNPHSAEGYLSHPSVRRVVNDTMRMDRMARFVLARDVAERLGSQPEVRHPVLVEALEPGFGALDEKPKRMQDVERGELRRLPKASGAPVTALSLEHRVASVATALEELVSDPEKARIDPLRRFVAAHLTADELQQVAARHDAMRVYAVWQSSRKSKLTDMRSMGAIKSDAALSSFRATGDRITWAVLDTGIQADHPHFKDSLTAVYDCTQKGPPQLMKKATDRDGHGTHVSGIIAGRSAARKPVGPNDEADLRGVAPSAKLIVYKVLDNNGYGEDAWIIKAIDHIAQQNENITDGLAVHGVNLSLGGPFDHTVYGCGFSPICAELRRLWRNGVLVVVACGNEGQLQVQTPDGEVEINTPMSVGDPANLEECIAVGSVNADRPHLYGVSPFSARGPTADGRAKPDVVAPGERILSCNSHWRTGKAGQYYFESGTSMAAPHVSGMLAAFLSVRREFRGRPDEVKRILLKSCIDLGRDRYHQGHGLPNLMQMLLAV